MKRILSWFLQGIFVILYGLILIFLLPIGILYMLVLVVEEILNKLDK